MTRVEMVERTKTFAQHIIRLAAKLPRTDVSRVSARRLLRSGTSVGANNRAASRSSTKKHFTSILTMALREADETLDGLELLAESGEVKPALLADLLDECCQLVAILSASVRTART